MNPERFRHSPSGRIVKVGQDEFAYWAFVPNPLPPELPLDLPLLQTLSRADRALGELAGLGRTISNPLPLLYLSAYFHRHREQYYDLLMAVSERGTWRDWTNFFLHGVAEQAQDAGAKARKLQDLQIEWRERLSHARTSALLLRLADWLFVSPFITIPKAQQYLAVTYPSAQRNIERLVEAGILQQLGDASYNRTFVAREILDLIEEDSTS